MTVLLITADANYQQALKSACEQAGHRCQAMSSGLFALTLLERSKPDVIISDCQLDDMSGQDFYEIVRSDSSLSGVRFLLLSADGRLEPGDLALPERDAGQIVEALTRLDSPRKQPFSGMLESPARRAQQHMSGTLEIITLYDLLVSLTQNQRSSTLRLRFGQECALIITHRGQVVHAAFRQQVGMPALLAIFCENEQSPSAEFVVETLEPADEATLARTIHTPVSQLLLEVAVELDHLRERLNAKGR